MSNTLICQKCHRSDNVLKALGKYTVTDGYAQCSICHCDLEYETVVIRQIHYDRKEKENIPLPKWLRNDLINKGILKT